MNKTAIQAAVDRLHANAVPTGKIKINGIVRLPNGNVLVTFNTRLIKQAKKWLREYLAN